MGAFTGKDLILAGLSGIGCSYTIEIFCLTFFAFRRRSGLYFWSLVSATSGVLTIIICNALSVWVLPPSDISIIVPTALGFLTYISSSYIILYSRLHLLQTPRLVMQWVLGIMLFEIVMVEIPQAVLIIGSIELPTSQFAVVERIWFRVEAPIYLTVDCIAGAVYIWQIKGILASSPPKAMRQTMMQLIGMTLFVVGADIAIVGTSFLPQFTVGLIVQGFLLALKLKMEIVVLNHLTDMSRKNLNSIERDFANGNAFNFDTPSYSNNTSSTQDLSRPH